MLQQEETVPCQYRTGRTLGSGTYGLVKEALHITTGKYYACKIISKKRMQGRKNMVYNEVDALKRVSASHPNIVTLHDYFESNHNLYFCFDLCTGGALFDSVCERGQYAETDAAELVRTIFGAVKYIHDCGIVHRDLKPENLLFRSELEKSSEIMVADFGLSYVMPDGELNLPMDVCGTPGYMAPEIFRKSGHGMPVDIWAIGVVTYFLLSGYLPFDRDTPNRETEAIIAGDYRFEPEEYWSNVSETARSFISTCLTVDPETRPTADEMLQHPWLVAEVPALEASDARKTGFRSFGEGKCLPYGTVATSGSRLHDHDQDPQQHVGAAGSNSTGKGSARPQVAAEASTSGKRSRNSAMRTPSSLLEGWPGSTLSPFNTLHRACLPLPSLSRTLFRRAD